MDSSGSSTPLATYLLLDKDVATHLANTIETVAAFVITDPSDLPTRRDLTSAGQALTQTLDTAYNMRAEIDELREQNRKYRVGLANFKALWVPERLEDYSDEIRDVVRKIFEDIDESIAHA